MKLKQTKKYHISFLFSDLFYHEFRLKDGMIKVFSFPSESCKEDFDFGYYNDAKIVFTCGDLK